MALSTEIIFTPQQLDRIGNKTISRIVDQADIHTTAMEGLYKFWKSLKGEKLQPITTDDLEGVHRVALRIISKCKSEDVGIISFYENIFPEILKSCVNKEGKLDPPILLYYRGNLDVLKGLGIAVIGTRGPTRNGILAGKHPSGEFAKRGCNIVSGLAIGCDTTGHQDALAVGGATTVFLANGLDWDLMYPKENLGLVREVVVKRGLLLSEYPVGQSCGGYDLIARDRLQAGLSYATVIVQTGVKGGTMHVANATIRPRKPLFAAEYKTDEDTSNEKVQGNIKLVREQETYALHSTSIDDACSIIEEAHKNINPVQRQSLF